MDGKQGLNQLEFSFEERKSLKVRQFETDDLTLIGKIKDEACCSSQMYTRKAYWYSNQMMFKYKRFIESNGLNFDEVLDEKQYLYMNRKVAMLQKYKIQHCLVIK